MYYTAMLLCTFETNYDADTLARYRLVIFNTLGYQRFHQLYILYYAFWLLVYSEKVPSIPYFINTSMILCTKKDTRSYCQVRSFHRVLLHLINILMKW
jgi:hypothetical protein